MRTLDTRIKVDFIRTDKNGPGSASSAESLIFQSRPSTGSRSMTDGATYVNEDIHKELKSPGSSKKPRPRSRTFTFSKSDQSPSKKHKPSRSNSRDRAQSGDVTPTAASKSSTSMGAGFVIAIPGRSSKAAIPNDFISYLQRTQKPEAVEIGKIHKLRQLLRNESVGWVDSFMIEGGMNEVVDLLYRIIRLEWRCVSISPSDAETCTDIAKGRNMKTHSFMRHYSV